MIDYGDDRDPDQDIWVYICMYDRDHPLTRFCALVAILAIVSWFLTQWLTP